MTYTYSDELFSDIYKDARGFRPRDTVMENWNSSTPDEKQDMWDSLQEEIVEDIEREREARAQAETHFRAEMEAIMELCNCNEADSIRHMAQADGRDINHMYDFEAFLWARDIVDTDFGHELMQNHKDGRFRK